MGRYMFRLSLFGMLVILTSLVYSAAILVTIDPQNNGFLEHIQYEDVTINKPFVLKLFWQNTGSIECNVRGRLDISANGKLEQTRWSNEINMMPGSYRRLDIYYYPENVSENFTGTLTVYSCNRIFEFETIDFFMNNTVLERLEEGNETIKVLNTKSYKGHVFMRLEAVEDIEEILIYSKSPPPEWIVETAIVEKIEKGDVFDVRVNYTPSVWRENILDFEIIDFETGNVLESFDVRVDEKQERKEKIINNVIFIFSGFAIGLAIMPLILAVKKRKSSFNYEKLKSVPGKMLAKASRIREQFKKKHKKS